MNSNLLRPIAFGVCALSLGVTLRAADPVTSIPQYARENGSFESIVVWTDRQMELVDLAGQAELVIEASTTGGRSHLDQSETHIFTDYPFTVANIIKNRRRPEIRAGATITVRRECGALQINGRPAVSIENEFPPFAARENYLLFLKPVPGEETLYEVFAGPQGAFRAGKSMTSIAKGVSVDRDVFLSELRALLKFTE